LERLLSEKTQKSNENPFDKVVNYVIQRQKVIEIPWEVLKIEKGTFGVAISGKALAFILS
jgi:hypothetical protein